MISHDGIWRVIDAIAARHGLTVSALARQAGLDPTTFNRSKRVGGGGRPRWPSTESLAKVLVATATTPQDLAGLMAEARSAEEAGEAGGAAGVPAVEGLVTGPAAARLARGAVVLPREAAVYLVPPPGLPPLYRDGDRLVLDLAGPPAVGDRALIVAERGAVLVGEVTAGGCGPALAIAADRRIIPLTPGGAGFAARIAWVGHRPPQPGRPFGMRE